MNKTKDHRLWDVAADYPIFSLKDFTFTLFARIICSDVLRR